VDPHGTKGGLSLGLTSDSNSLVKLPTQQGRLLRYSTLQIGDHPIAANSNQNLQQASEGLRSRNAGDLSTFLIGIDDDEHINAKC